MARQILLPVVLGVAGVAGLVAAFLLWATAEANNVAAERQRRIVATVLSHSIASVAHDQEGATVWDDAVLKVRARRLDLEWVDGNLGVWFHDYFGHDETYVLTDKNEAIYAMRGGHRANPAMFARYVADDAGSLIAELRKTLAHPSPPDLAPSVLTPGAIDLGVVNGRPAIISIKPIVSETGRVVQKPGAEYLHVSVRYLDRSFLNGLAREYWLEQPRFAWSATAIDPEASTPLHSRRDGNIGYITWQPFAPGTQVFGRLAPALALTLLFGGLVAGMMLRRLRLRTMELHASEAQAQHLAFHDTLTGLANRALFENRLDHELASVRRGGPGIALLFLDLDGFKLVNDTLGHPAGDELIRELGRRLSETAREADTVARLGGDEFAVIQTGVSNVADVEILCMRIIEAVAAPFDLIGSQVNVGISIGIAISPGHAVDRVELGRKADIALYSAKTTGRGRFVVFDDAMDDTIKRRRAIERDLRTALVAGDQLELLYQPVYSTQSRRMKAVEALVRWRHPDHGLMTPATFIPVAEETGLIEPLGEWVLAQACAAALEWPVETIAVNVSAVQLRNPRFAERAIAIITDSGLDPGRLELEITETSFLDNIGHCGPNLAALRAHGIRIALDDFGTGYSSFNHLRLFHVDRLKIDRSFVNGICHAGDESPIIRAIVGLAKASGIEVTAEGVETAEQLQFLADVGCDMLQGYLFSRPVNRASIRAMFDYSAVADRL
jgi:diguanylate cyclase (GGDEF)-like protein